MDLAALARDTGAGIPAAVAASAAVGELLGLSRLQDWTVEQPGDSHWVVAARAALRDEVDRQQVALAGALLRNADGDVTWFAGRHANALARFAAVGAQAGAARDDLVARGCVLASELRRLVSALS